MSDPTPQQRPHAEDAILLAGCTVLVLLAFTLHPDESGSTPAAILAAIARSQGRAHLVHGTMLAAFAAYAVGMTGYAQMLGLQLRWVRSALVCYLLGTALVIPAIVLDGFVTPALAAHILAAPPDMMPIGRELMHAAGSIIAYLIETGFVLMAAAMGVWAIAQLRQPAARKIAAGVMLAAASLALLGVAGVAPRLAPVLIPALLLLQTIWNLAAAWQMLRAPAAVQSSLGEFSGASAVSSR